MARSGVVGMLVLGARAGRRKAPFRPTEVRLLSVLANRAALALENHLYQRELISSERMAALGAMAGMLAHDFRNPMTVVRGHAEMLLEDGLRLETVRAQAELIVRMVDRLDRMTGEILDFARAGGRVVLRRLPLRRFFGELADDLEKELPGVSIVRTFDLPEEATGALDEDKMRRAVGNLTSNARDVMGGRGVVHLAVRLVPAGRRAGAAAHRGGRRRPGRPAGDPRDPVRALRDRAQEGRDGAGPGRGAPLRRGPRGDDRARRQSAVRRPHGARFRLLLPLVPESRPGGDDGAR